MNKILSKNKLTQKDADGIAEKIKKSAAKRFFIYCNNKNKSKKFLE